MTETPPAPAPAFDYVVAGIFGDGFGDDIVIETSFDEVTVTVPPTSWTAALTAVRDKLGLTFLDWLTAVDEEADGFTVVAHVCAVEDGIVPRASRLLVRTRIPNDKAELATATEVYRGANWHERETFEMFGITFPGHPNLIPLLLPDGFEGHPLRKDFVLAARVAKEWPGVKEPGEGGHGGGGAAAKAAPGKTAATRAAPTSTRRRMVPPGVPDGWLKPLPEPTPEPLPEPDPSSANEPAAEAPSAPEPPATPPPAPNEDPDPEAKP